MTHFGVSLKCLLEDLQLLTITHRLLRLLVLPLGQNITGRFEERFQFGLKESTFIDIVTKINIQICRRQHECSISHMASTGHHTDFEAGSWQVKGINVHSHSIRCSHFDMNLCWVISASLKKKKKKSRVAVCEIGFGYIYMRPLKSPFRHI